MATGIANGLLVQGWNISCTCNDILLGSDEHKAHATAISIILPLTIVSSFFTLKIIMWTGHNL